MIIRWGWLCLWRNFWQYLEAFWLSYFGWKASIFLVSKDKWWLPWWLSGKESTCQCRRCRFDPGVRKIPCRRKWQPTPVVLPGKSCGQRDLAGYTAWGGKESDNDLPTKKQRPGVPLRIWQRLKAKPTMNRRAPDTTEWFKPECQDC